MENIVFDDRKIGKGYPSFVIAEAGSNHNGSLDQAKNMIEVAAEAGADAVKFQVFRASTMYPDKKIEVTYLKNMGVADDLYSIIKRLEIPYEWLGELHQYAGKCGLEFMATPFDIEAVTALDPYVSVYKIASYEALYSELIEAVKQSGKPLFISTGACTEREIALLINKSLLDYKDKTVLLHCIAKYPAPLNQINLNVITHFIEDYGIHAGFSDHTAHPFIAPVGAVILGAVVIEKHFTLSKKLPGPDHAFALEPAELKTMIESIRSAEKTVHFRKDRRTIHPCERELYHYKRCLYYKKKLSKGHVLKESDFIILRNTGIACNWLHPLEMNLIVGKILQKNIRENDLVVKEDVK